MILEHGFDLKCWYLSMELGDTLHPTWMHSLALFIGELLLVHLLLLVHDSIRIGTLSTLLLWLVKPGHVRFVEVSLGLPIILLAIP